MKTAFTTCAAVVAALVAAGSGSAAANSPVPVPGTSSCSGQLVAISNHGGHGPGYYLKTETAGVIAEYRDEYCGS